MPDPKPTGDADATRARVAPALPLALLETVRSRDLPPEILEGEDLPASLPRRLGLSDVVARQIQRYRDAQRRGERIDAQEVADLMRLILRRPDSGELLRDTGRELARRQYGRLTLVTRAALRIMPRRLVHGALRRAARRLLRPLAGALEVEDAGAPLLARIRSPLTAMDESGTACELFSGALEELASLYLRTPVRVEHARCEVRGDATCEWCLAGSG